MAFQRYDGYAGSVPQQFVDRSIPICPFCGTSHPHWGVDISIEFKIDGTQYRYMCEQCHGVLETNANDVTGQSSNPFTATGLRKMFAGKKSNTVYIRVVSAGNNGELKECVGKEYTLEDINQMAYQKVTGNK